MSKLKVGIIGCGGIARRSHMPAWLKQNDAEVVAISDVNSDCAKAFAEQFDIKHVFSDYKEMVKMDELDAVDICTPNDLHALPTIAALEAGKHVLVEKPIARNAKEGQTMIDAAEKSGKKLMVAQCLRFKSESLALKRFVDAGEMGEMYYSRIQAVRRRGIPSWGNFIDKEKQGGGPLIDLGVHILDATMWLMGHPKPVAASGITYTKFGNKEGVFGGYGPWDYKNYTVEDFAAALIRFENGATMTIESSFAANIEKDQMNMSILGTEGGCQWNPLKLFSEKHGTLVDVTPVSLPHIDMYEGEIRAFLDSITNDTVPPVTGEQALLVSKILDAIYESSERGMEVKID